MNFKRNEGLAGIDMIIAISAIIIFSALILTLITNNSFENVKNAKESMAIIYITEIFENIGIEKYENITEDYVIANLIPKELSDKYIIEVNIENDFSDILEEDIIKKINVKLIYIINNKEYECSMERLKTKE